MRRHLIPALATALVLAVASPGALGWGASHGALKQLAGVAGCVSETGSGGSCADGKALGQPFAVAVSPDGKNVYAASQSDELAIFARNMVTGALVQLAGTAGCISETGSGGTCVDGKALDGPVSVAVSPDGASVYVGSLQSDAIAIFARDAATGKLSQLAGTAGCISETGSAGTCVDGKALDYGFGIAVSPDGKNVYVASGVSDAVAVFTRFKNGGLRQLSGTNGCVSETGSGPCADGKALNGAQAVAVSADGKHVYVASYDSDAVAVFARNSTTGALTQLAGADGCVSETGSGPCTDGKGLDSPHGVALSADAASVYVGSAGASPPSNGAVAVFKRNAPTGKLTQLTGTDGCVSETGSGGACADGKALLTAPFVTVAADGNNVYVASSYSDAVAVFARAASGALSQLVGTDGCVSETGTGGDCADGKALDGARGAAVSPDGKNVYAASGQSKAVAAFTRHS